MNTYHYYTTLRDVNAPGRFSFYVDGQLWDVKNLDWQPNEAQLSGEISTAASQMQGGYNYPMYVKDIAVWCSGGWRRPTFNVYNDNWSYFGVWGSGADWYQEFAIWDTYCAD